MFLKWAVSWFLAKITTSHMLVNVPFFCSRRLIFVGILYLIVGQNLPQSVQKKTNVGRLSGFLKTKKKNRSLWQGKGRFALSYRKRLAKIICHAFGNKSPFPGFYDVFSNLIHEFKFDS